MTLLLSLLGNRFALIPIAALAGFFYGFYSVPRVDVKAIENNVATREKAVCDRKLANLRTDAEKTISDILGSIKENEPDVSKTAKELCADDPLCVEGGK